jgi:methionine synthase II (cobalamin-independent)
MMRIRSFKRFVVFKQVRASQLKQKLREQIKATQNRSSRTKTSPLTNNKDIRSSWLKNNDNHDKVKSAVKIAIRKIKQQTQATMHEQICGNSELLFKVFTTTKFV